MATKRVYLDVCVLCRPFDDQQQARIRLETEALALILAHIRESDCDLISSPVHHAEIESIRQPEERQHLQLLLERLGTQIPFDLSAARQRAETLADTGMGVTDAVHVAFAERAQADFITVDDRLLKQCNRLVTSIWCGSPLAYCEKEKLR
jgi:predicted nucleic acid-binding protein